MDPTTTLLPGQGALHVVKLIFPFSSSRFIDLKVVAAALLLISYVFIFAFFLLYQFSNPQESFPFWFYYTRKLNDMIFHACNNSFRWDFLFWAFCSQFSPQCSEIRNFSPIFNVAPKLKIQAWKFTLKRMKFELSRQKWSKRKLIFGAKVQTVFT